MESLSGWAVEGVLVISRRAWVECSAQVLHSLTSRPRRRQYAQTYACQACSTVVWSRPPNWRPMAGSDSPVSSRARYMATCRGHAMRAVRAVREELLRGEPEVRAGGELDLADCALGCPALEGCVGRGCRVPPAPAQLSAARPVSELKATTRIRAPSSARTLEWTRSAITSSAVAVGELDAVVLHALAQYREPCGELRRSDVGDEPGLEALA